MRDSMRDTVSDRREARKLTQNSEKSIIWTSRLGARLFDYISQRRASASGHNQYREIAQDLTSRISDGRLLDVGTGPGRLLKEVHELNQDIWLFGLDLSEAMTELARKHLEGIERVDLRQGSIEETDYQDDYFDLITCASSFYIWNRPEKCLEEIYRILKPGCSAIIFENHSDYDIEGFQNALKSFLQRENFIRRPLITWFNKRALAKMYTTKQIQEILKGTDFAEDFVIERTTLSELPIWLRITLVKRLRS